MLEKLDDDDELVIIVLATALVVLLVIIGDGFLIFIAAEEMWGFLQDPHRLFRVLLAMVIREGDERHERFER